MIFVTVGTEQYPFNRLLNWVNAAVQKDNIQEEIVVQAGACTNAVVGATMHTRLSQSDFADCVRRSRLIVSHCGEGSFFHLRSAGKPFILVPRRLELGEHVDDHQWELAKVLLGIGANVGWIPRDIRRFVAEPFFAPGAFPIGTSLVDQLIERYEPIAHSQEELVR